MRHVYIAQSLDGYIAAPDGDIAWLHAIDNPEGSDFGFAQFMHKIDAIVMGRNTFEKVLSFGEWPYTKPVYVISSSLTSLPNSCAERAFLLDASPRTVVALLEERGLHQLYIDGGALIRSFLREDLIDTLTISTLPIILGDGIPLFDKLDKSIALKLEHSKTLAGQLVQTTYSISGESKDLPTY